MLGVSARAYEPKARRIVEDNWRALEAVARLLLWREDASGREVRTPMRQYGSRPWFRPALDRTLSTDRR